MQAVFEYLDQFDLGAMADVNYRFRQNALAHLSETKSRDLKIKKLCVSDENQSKAIDVLRNFNKFIGPVQIVRSNEPSKILRILNRYCREQLTGLCLQEFEPFGLEDLLTCTVQPLFSNLAKLKLDHPRTSFNQSLLKMLPLWCPNLEELELEFFMNSYNHPFELLPLRGLHRSFSKLKSISLTCVMGLVDNDIDQFIKFNPQIVHVALNECEGLTERSLQTVAKSSQVETVLFDMGDCHYEIQSNDLSFLVGFDLLSKLKRLKLGAVEHALSILHEIVARKIPIEDLCVVGFGYVNTNLLVAKITSLKKLRILHLRFTPGLKTSHVHCISKQLSELTHLLLHFTSAIFFTQDLLDLIQNSKKLQSLILGCVDPNDVEEWTGTEIRIDDEIFKKIVDLVATRSVKLPLKVVLESLIYIVNVSKKMIDANKELLTLEIGKDVGLHAGRTSHGSQL